jgi:hypothetical protein
MSTFLVECDAAAWQAYGFEHKTIEQSQAICEEIFASTLDGHALVSNKSVWRNFPWIWNENWSHGNMVLIGDALHSAHFSIGSGTRLAIEDAIALPRSRKPTFRGPQPTRRSKPIVLVKAARAPAPPARELREHMKLDLWISPIATSPHGPPDDRRPRAMSPASCALRAAAPVGFARRQGQPTAAARPRAADGGRAGNRLYCFGPTTPAGSCSTPAWPRRRAVGPDARSDAGTRADRAGAMAFARFDARRSHPDVADDTPASGGVLRRCARRLRRS